MGWLDGRAVLLTGGGSGIGRGVVDTFIAEGARIGILELSAKKASQLTTAHGDAVRPIVGDATSLEANELAVQETLSAFGKIDVLVCCVGLWDYFTSMLDLPKDKLSDAFDEIFAINVKSYMLSVKAALSSLLTTEGNIVLTISNAGFYPAGGGALYTASKFAVRGLLTQLAYELAPTVRVNGVAPGGTVTQLCGLEALGQREMAMADVPDIDDLIRSTNPLQVTPTARDHSWAYLLLAAKERTTAITGTIIQSDGGLGYRGLTRLAGLVDESESKLR